MVEPIIIGTTSIAILTAISDAYTRIVNNLTSAPDAQVTQVRTACTQILEMINAQNEAPFRAAEMALKRGDKNRALECMETGLSQDVLNAKGWAIYAGILSLQGHHDLAKSIFVQMVDWFGHDCPALPGEIRESIAVHNQITVVSPTPIEKTIYGQGTGWDHTKDAAVSGAGLAAAFYRYEPWTIWSKEKMKVRVYFQPWIGSEEKCVFSTDSHAVLTRGHFDHYPAGFHIAAMTNRFLAITNHTVIDLAENCRAIHCTDPQKIPAAFGKTKFGVTHASQQVHGIDITLGKDIVESEVWGGAGPRYSYQVDYTKPKVVAKPPIVPPKQIEGR